MHVYCVYQTLPDGLLQSLSLLLILRAQLFTMESSRIWALLISRANTWSSSSTLWICEYMRSSFEMTLITGWLSLPFDLNVHWVREDLQVVQLVKFTSPVLYCPYYKITTVRLQTFYSQRLSFIYLLSVFVMLQHLCVSNRDHLIQRQSEWVPWRQLWGGGCVCGLSLHPSGMDQHSTQGPLPHLIIIQ